MKKLCLALFSAMFLFSCSSDDDGGGVTPKPDKGGDIEFSSVKEVKVNAKAFDKWIYYSIEKGEVVEVKDFKNSLDWDIAFHRYDVRLNGGMSGKGKGEALKVTASSLDEVKEVPKDAKFVKDEMGDIIIAYSSGKPKMEKQPFNQEMKWIKFTPTGNGPSYEMMEDDAFIIKTASGKYAKIKFISYLDDSGQGGLVTWKYALLK